MARKIISFVLLLALLAGCSPAAAPTAQPTEAAKAAEATKAPEATKAAPKETVMLDYYIMGTDPTNRADVEKAINDYIEPLIGAKVTFHFIGWGDWASKTITGIEAGEKMDVVFVADWYYYMQLVSEGLLTPLNDDNGPNGNLIAQYGQGITSSLNPAFLTGSAIDGVNYAIPTNKELSVPWGFLYNATIADEIGFTDADAAAVKSMKDLEPWVAKAKEAHPDLYPYNTDGSIGFMPYVHAFATNISNWVINTNAIPDANGKVDESIFVPFETPWMADYLTIVRDWYVKGYINPDAGLTTYDTSVARNAGNFFIEPMPLKGNGIKAAEMMNASGNKDLKLKELYGMPKVINTSDAGGSMLAIPAASQYPVQAMQLLNLMHSDKKLLNMMVFGVEGTHWSLDPDGRVNMKDDTWLKAHPGPWVWADVLLQYVTNTQDPQTNQLLIDYAKDAFPEPSLGFRFRTEPVAAEITALNAVVDGSSRALLTGYVDPAVELPKFIQAMKDAGLEKVLAEVQKQYDEWKAKK
jgi:putative aldouronate transport system substrate-binding protein